MKHIFIQDIIENPRPFIFTAPNRCPPCKKLDEMYKNVDYPAVHIDFEDSRQFTEEHKLQIMHVPMAIDYKDGKFVVSQQHAFEVMMEAHKLQKEARAEPIEFEMIKVPV